MCRARRNYVRRGNRGVKVLKQFNNPITGVKVELTRKTTIAGDIIYAVVVTNTDTGKHRLINVYNNIMEAFKFYKYGVVMA